MLTEAQILCLRLVNQHKSSKEIAIALKISHYTVDQRVARACKLIGANSRWEVARLLAEYEARLGYGPLAYETLDIAVTDGTVPPLPHSLTEEEQSGSDGVLDEGSGHVLHLADHSVAFDHTETGTDKFGPLLFPRQWGQPNALSITNRLIAAFVIFLASIMITGFLIAALEALSRLLGRPT